MSTLANALEDIRFKVSKPESAGGYNNNSVASAVDVSGYKNRLTVEPAKEESVAAQKGPKLKLKIKPLKAPGPAESPKDQPPVEQVPKKVKKSKKKLRDFSSLTCCDFLWDQLHRGHWQEPLLLPALTLRSPSAASIAQGAEDDEGGCPAKSPISCFEAGYRFECNTATKLLPALRQVEHAPAAVRNAEQDAIVVALLLREMRKQKRQQQLHLSCDAKEGAAQLDARAADAERKVKQSQGVQQQTGRQSVKLQAYILLDHLDIAGLLKSAVSSTQELKSFMQPTTNHLASPPPNGTPVHHSALDKGSTPSTQAPAPQCSRRQGPWEERLLPPAPPQHSACLSATDTAQRQNRTSSRGGDVVLHRPLDLPQQGWMVYLNSALKLVNAMEEYFMASRSYCQSGGVQARAGSPPASDAGLIKAGKARPWLWPPLWSLLCLSDEPVSSMLKPA
ncbi:hypothetical protein ABBQ38_010944 [Trebouxia sp. C0009 RCD-2024]